MEDEDLQRIWQSGNQAMLKDLHLERGQLEGLLQPKVLRANRSIHLNLAVYMTCQLAAMVFIGMDVYGYRTNPLLLAVLVTMLFLCAVFLGYGVFLANYLRQINLGTYDLVTMVQKRIKAYGIHYEIWMWMGAVSCLCLSYALNAWIDNDQGTYRINHPWVFAGISLAVLVFIYGAQKVNQWVVLREIKAYLADLQANVLDQSYELAQTKKRHLVFGVVLFVVLCFFFILGIIKALGR